MTDYEQITSAERRQSLRVLAAGLYVVYSIVPDELIEETRRSVLSQNNPPEDLQIEADKLWHTNDVAEKMDDQFAELRRFLRQIDSKLDYLISVAEGRKPKTPRVEHTVNLTDISGGGIAFHNKTEIAAGTLLHIRLQLSRFPLLEICATADVAWSKPVVENDKQKFEIGTSFDTILEDDRERLFRFISRLERQVLRERKESKTV